MSQVSSVSFDAPSRTFLLTTPATSYALRIGADDAPHHLHWGPRLTLGEAASLPVHSGVTSSFASTGGEELGVEGGPRFGVPSLLVRYANGARGVEWRYAGHDIADGRLSVRLRDRHYPLGCTLHYTVHQDSDVIERSLTLSHVGPGTGSAQGDGDDTAPIEVLRCDAAAWSVPAASGARLSHTVGDWSGESQLRRTEAPFAETTFTSRRGISGHAGNPWLMVDAGDADETGGAVWSMVLAWSGSWRITAYRDHTGGPFTVTGGAGHDGLTWRLAPGEHHETPVFAGQFSQGGFGGTSRGWHAYIAAHVLPRPDELRPVVYNSWEATGWNVTLEGQRALAERAAELGVEVFVVDDGWFGARTSDRAGLGDWHPSPERFPDGLAPLVDAVRGLGMRFGLWVEPEMTNPDSDLYRAHPDWVLHMPHRRRTELRHQLVLNFARPDVTEWAFGWLDRLVATYAIDFLKWDMNRAFTEAGHPGAPDAERLWSDHTRGVYAVLDRLRAAHPGLRVEGCAGGGGRADLGMLARTDQTWISDNTDATDRIAIQHGYSQIYPARTMSAWVTDSPNPHTGRTASLRRRFHVAMAGALGIGGDLSRWTAAELAEARDLVAEYKEIRPVVQHGERYRLEDAVLYRAADRVVVIAWGQDRSLRLTGLSPTARYVDEATGTEHHGAVLLTHGLPLHLPGEDTPSTLIRLRRS
ncbi:alpha-galactosidase [Streptomyces sp. NPDC093085]|uniref:alpha-galactosidase n=1 Tax=Streptomyces sp. NPDC093085 TaxID=3155068 RepID=UPI00343A63F0